VNRLLPSPWWDAEKTWRLRRAGLTLEPAEELWSRARPIVSGRLQTGAAVLKEFIEKGVSPYDLPAQERFV